MKLLIKYGRGQTRIVDASKVEEFTDMHRVFVPDEKPGYVKQEDVTVKLRYFVVHGDELKKPIRATGFEVIQEKQIAKESVTA